MNVSICHKANVSLEQYLDFDASFDVDNDLLAEKESVRPKTCSFARAWRNLHNLSWSLQINEPNVVSK
jgi:hypothetical protein